MTHNPVSHHVETRYSHWYVALGVGVLARVAGKDNGAVSTEEITMEVGVVNLFGVWNKYTITSHALIYPLTVPSGSK